MLHKIESVQIEETSAARVLIVDDSSLGRLKLKKAVTHLGYEVALAEDGASAVSMLQEGDFDAVLLDIVMPEIDGFDVLRLLQADHRLRDIPVIVVSSLDDERDSVVKALELGAQDFLPKDFDPVILRARLDTSVVRKRFRDREREYFGRIEKLTEAAKTLEAGHFSPDELLIGDLAMRNDPLGRLAAVFQGMATEIYEREVRSRHTIQRLQGGFLVIAVGIIWGLTPSLARMASGMGSTPLGLALWVNVVASVFCLSIAAWRGGIVRLDKRMLMFVFFWACIAGIVQRLVTMIVAENVEAAMLSLIVTTQGFMVFTFAALLKIEKAMPRRLAGLTVGLCGVAVVMWTQSNGVDEGRIGWLVIALLLPLAFAIEGLLVAARRPKSLDIFYAVGLMMGLSAIFLAPVALFIGEARLSAPEPYALAGLIGLMGITGALSLLLCFRLIATAGAVFASQSAYAMTLAGIFWGMILLDEDLSLSAWTGVAIILFGLYLVEPQRQRQKVVLNRNFSVTTQKNVSR